MNQPHDIHQTFQVVTCPHGSTLPAASLHREPLDQKRNPPSEFPGDVLSCVLSSLLRKQNCSRCKTEFQLSVEILHLFASYLEFLG